MIRDTGALGEKLGSIRYPPYDMANLATMTKLLKKREMPNVMGAVTVAVTLGAAALSAVGIRSLANGE